ncbi:MAG: M20 family metallo-hydrolase [Rikenellaceae bacterium]|jgi:acetylornithine deacetylase|nr:M20 family metallo-hydrolase [Rikenellaceae bacterium]
MDKMYKNAIALLQMLIATPSLSSEEQDTATIVRLFLKDSGVDVVHQLHNNVWAVNRWFDPAKPTILLNSHHDTVAPNPAYTRSPFEASIEGDRLYGLGGNDAGASVVSLLSVFLYNYNRRDMRYNLCIAITAEEEISGRFGLECLLPQLGELDFAIVGEPTRMQLATAERGLMVIDCIARGRSGHAAREEGDNAIYKAIKDIEWFRDYRFAKVSESFGQVKMNVTILHAGTQHNVVPAECRFTVDVRVTDCYTNEEVLEEIRRNVSCDVIPRSTRLKPSYIPKDHPIVQAGIALGRTCYGSPTTSDQALLSIPSLKIGPGDSARSHTADEFVLLSEIKEGTDLYIKLLDAIL